MLKQVEMYHSFDTWFNEFMKSIKKYTMGLHSFSVNDILFSENNYLYFRKDLIKQI